MTCEAEAHNRSQKWGKHHPGGRLAIPITHLQAKREAVAAIYEAKPQPSDHEVKTETPHQIS